MAWTAKNDSTVIPKANIMYSLIKVASHKEEDGYCFDPETTIGIIFGELEAPYESERVRAIEELFADTGIHFRHTDYIREEMWSKFRLNVCNNLPRQFWRGSWLLQGQHSHEGDQ